MVIQKEQPIAMPKPAWAKQPVIGSRPRDDGKPGVQYSVQITGAIQSIYQFTELCELLLNKCTEDDLVDIMIDTPGGCVFSTLLLLSWMKACKAKVTAVASGLVASAGTILWFYAENKKLEDWSHFMFHYTSHGDCGKTLDIQETATNMVKYMRIVTIKNMVEDGLLKPEEAKAMFTQKKDLFLPQKIVRGRMLTIVAATEGFKVVNEDLPVQEDPDGGEGNKNDHETDPEGNPDPNANPEIDPNEQTAIDPEAIFRAEGVEPETGDGDGDGDQGGDQGGDGDGDGTEAPDDKKGKGKKAKKTKKRCKGEDEGGDNGGTGDGDGDANDPDTGVDPDEATSPTDYLKW